jgi:hypothetical protein
MYTRVNGHTHTHTHTHTQHVLFRLRGRGRHNDGGPVRHDPGLHHAAGRASCLAGTPLFFYMRVHAGRESFESCASQALKSMNIGEYMLRMSIFTQNIDR